MPSSVSSGPALRTSSAFTNLWTPSAINVIADITLSGVESEATLRFGGGVGTVTLAWNFGGGNGADGAAFATKLLDGSLVTTITIDATVRSYTVHVPAGALALQVNMTRSSGTISGTCSVVAQSTTTLNVVDAVE